MGQLNEYVCNSCGYRAEVSGGGDAGMESVTVTIVCEDCRKLYDIQIGNSDWTDEQIEAQRTFKFRCPRRATHRIKEWTDGGPCPQCGVPMENKGGTVLWD
jgi:Zn finger protein HypA/HybF involved in hydrogenase expression